MSETPSATTSTVEERRTMFLEWVRDVRDPATENSEGIRRIATSDETASASYEIAPLPDGTWAIRITCDYRCGNSSGRAIPWTRKGSRDECIALFLATARDHFEPIHHDASDRQRRARIEMQALLADGLFGFLEPDPGPTGLGRVPASRSSVG